MAIRVGFNTALSGDLAAFEGMKVAQNPKAGAGFEIPTRTGRGSLQKIPHVVVFRA